jgi:enoyl-[acyl-carrier protein] reductase I
MNSAQPFEGKRALVFGLANERSIAWGITRVLQEQGCRDFVFTYAGEAFEKRMRPLAESVDARLILPCDVADDAQIDHVFDEVGRIWDGIDVLIHSIAFAERQDLEGRFVDTSRAGFLKAMEISAYSLVHLARKAEPLLAARRGSIVTLTYYGAVKVVPNYNVMGVAKATLEASVRYLASDLGASGIRVNAISAGPIKTLAAVGIRGFRGLLSLAEEKAPLRRTVTQEEVGRTAAFLCGEGGAGITGETLYVDAGYNVMAV